MQTICISLGGSIVSREDGFNLAYVNKLAKLLKEFSDKYKFIIVVGGGYTNKVYVDSIKKQISNNYQLDGVGIAVTRVNALVIKDVLSSTLDVYQHIAMNLEEVKNAIKESSIVVMGGLLPGITTDATAVLACECIESKAVINVSSLGYVYDKPPQESGAKKLMSLSHDTLLELAAMYDSRHARTHFIFDFVASKLAKRSNIKIYFVDERIEELQKVLNGKKHDGSTVE